MVGILTMFRPAMGGWMVDILICSGLLYLPDGGYYHGVLACCGGQMVGIITVF
jgi:hypothetical protein